MIIRHLFFRAMVLTAFAIPALAQNVIGDEPNRGGELNLEATDVNVARERLFPAEGYDVNLFASEQDFPIGNPVSLKFDAKGRMWVVTMPSYPQRLPDEDPDDKLVILEDTDGDGVADKHTVFADKLHVPTGFEIGDGGAYIAHQPNLIFAKDTDGDDIADVRETILHGFGTEDSHHSISAFTWGPGGGLYFQEGTFHHSQVETPWGPVRLVDAGVFRYEPLTFKLEVFVTYGFANPWGHVFDRWGQNFIADASGGSNYFGSAMTGYLPYPEKHPGMKVFTSVVRPTAGCEIVRSRHFPDEAQGNFLVNNCIGFQGIKQHQMMEEDSGFTSKEVEPLLYSTDINFRPVDIQFGPDGALYIVDWFNPLIGHMQYSLRDTRRDHGHGRIWRITYKSRPLLEPAKIDGEPIPALLELLKAYEDRTRYRVRIELRNRDRQEVARELEKWIAGLDQSDPEYEHHLLEALWVYQTICVYNTEHLERVLNSPEPRARAAAARVVRYWRDQLPNALDLLEARVNDEFPRARLEALLSLSYIPEPRAAEIALAALNHSTDYYLDYVMRETVRALAPQWKPGIVDGSLAKRIERPQLDYLLSRVSPGELAGMAPNEAVHEAMLTRKGVASDNRQQALDALAKAEGGDEVTIMTAMLMRLDQQGGDDAREVIRDLTKLLTALPERRLNKAAPQLHSLIDSARLDDTRKAAYAGLIAAGEAEATWNAAEATPNAPAEFIAAIPAAPAERLTEELYEHVSASLDGDEKVRRAAIEVLPEFGAHHTASFARLSGFVHQGIEPAASLNALKRIPQGEWQGDRLADLSAGVLAFVEQQPIQKLSEPEVRTAFDVGAQLAALLPGDAGPSFKQALANRDITSVEMQPIPHRMVFDIAEFYVPAGRPVEIRLVNNDIMPHNLVVTAPGALRKVGMEAEATAMDPESERRGYVPDLPEVLHATKLVYPAASETLTFVAPAEPGAYPFVCTFPGHWILMNGTMHVVPEVDASMVAKRTESTAGHDHGDRRFVKMWNLDELLPDIERATQHRSFANGKALFESVGCKACHVIGGEGATLGPDLTTINEKYKLQELLEHIMDPSKLVEEDYIAYIIETSDFETYSGMIAEQNDQVVRVHANPANPEDIVDIPRADIESMDKSPLSTMPTGLLSTMNAEEIYDLLAFIMAGGDGTNPAFSK